MTRLSMSSTDGQTSKSSKLIYGGVTTVLVVGTALICYYRGKKTGENNQSAAKVSQDTAVQAAVAQEKAKSKLPAALNFVMLDDNATKLRTAMLKTMAIEDSASDHGMSAQARLASLNNFNKNFGGETVYNSVKYIDYFTKQLSHDADAYNAQLAKIKANKDKSLTPKLAQELRALPNPVQILEANYPGINGEMGTKPNLTVVALVAGNEAANLKSNEDNRKAAFEWNQKLQMKKLLNNIRIAQSNAGEICATGCATAGSGSWLLDWTKEKESLDALVPVPESAFKLVDDEIAKIKAAIKTANATTEAQKKATMEEKQLVVTNAGAAANATQKDELLAAQIAYAKAQAATEGNSAEEKIAKDYEDRRAEVTDAFNLTAFTNAKNKVLDAAGALKGDSSEAEKDAFSLISQQYTERLIALNQAKVLFDGDYDQLSEQYKLDEALKARATRQALFDQKPKLVDGTGDDATVESVTYYDDIKYSYLTKRVAELHAFSLCDGSQFNKAKALVAVAAVKKFVDGMELTGDAKAKYTKITSDALDTPENRKSNRRYLDNMVAALLAVAKAENDYYSIGDLEKIGTKRADYDTKAKAVSDAADATATQKKDMYVALGALVNAIQGLYGIVFYSEKLTTFMVQGTLPMIDNVEIAYGTTNAGDLKQEIKDVDDADGDVNKNNAINDLLTKDNYKYYKWIVEAI